MEKSFVAMLKFIFKEISAFVNAESVCILISSAN